MNSGPTDGAVVRRAERKPILQVVSRFAGSQLIALVLKLAGGLLQARFVGPAVLGLFNSLSLVTQYLPFLTLGVGSGLNRELPYLIGKEDLEGVRRYQETAGAWFLLIAGGAGVALLSISVWCATTGRGDLAFGWFSISVVVFSQVFGQTNLGVLYRCHGEFDKLALIQVLQSGLSFALVVLVLLFEFYGLCLRVMLAWGVGLWLLWTWRPLPVRPRFDRDVFFRLVRTGVPIFGIGYLGQFWNTLNSTLILRFAGTEQLGLYAIANLASQSLLLFQGSLGQVLFPRLVEEYGRTGSIRSVVRYLIRPLVIVLLINGVSAILAWFALPSIIEWLLPKYVNGISAARWAVVAAGTMGFTPLNMVFNVTMKQGRYVVALVVGMGAYLVILAFLLKNGINLSDFPKALVGGRAVFIFVSYAMVYDLCRHDQSVSL